MLGTKIKFEGVKGVGTVELDLQEDQRVYTLIGTNGVGKTKTLEALFQVLFFTNSKVIDSIHSKLASKNWVFKSGVDSSRKLLLLWTGEVSSNVTTIPDPGEVPPSDDSLATLFLGSTFDSLSSEPMKSSYQHSLPVVYLASQSRGFIDHNDRSLDYKPVSIGTFHSRRNAYFREISRGMVNGFSSLNMSSNIEQWFVTLAQSSNKFQKGSDNREIEISTVLKLLNMLDTRIDSEYLEIDGDGRVSLKVEGQPRELSHLSTGFASIVKIIQAIVSGYGAYTNENNLVDVKGIVLIDEIESHLHLTWQARIIPLLKQLFPNTIFYITTHSSIVLSQLQEGEAYRLERHEDGTVRTKIIKRPNKASIIDLLQDAFDIDVNKIKRESISPESQRASKQKLLDLLLEEDSDL